MYTVCNQSFHIKVYYVNNVHSGKDTFQSEATVFYSHPPFKKLCMGLAIAIENLDYSKI